VLPFFFYRNQAADRAVVLAFFMMKGNSMTNQNQLGQRNQSKPGQQQGGGQKPGQQSQGSGNDKNPKEPFDQKSDSDT
jgi:hypothetical protein